jgi:hypothetical protein
MIKTFKFLLFACLLIFALSWKYEGKTLFSYAYKYTSELSKPTQEVATEYYNKGLYSTRKISRDLFENSVPKIKDSVKSKLSSKKISNEEKEEINEEDKKKLENLLEN